MFVKSIRTSFIASLLLCLIFSSSIAAFANESPQIKKVEVQEYPGQLQVNIYASGQVQYKVIEQKKT